MSSVMSVCLSLYSHEWEGVPVQDIIPPLYRTLICTELFSLNLTVQTLPPASPPTHAHDLLSLKHGCRNAGGNEIEFSRNTHFILFKFQNKEDIKISDLYMKSKHHGKCLIALKLLQLSTILNLFSLEVVQKIPMLSTLCITGKLKCLLVCLSLSTRWQHIIRRYALSSECFIYIKLPAHHWRI